MIDSLAYYRQKATKLNTAAALNLEPKSYVIVTMHRPSNVDTEGGLLSIIEILENTAPHKRIVFPIHPRTSNNIERFGLKARFEAIPNITILEPQGYLEFLNLMDNAFCIITDSGGIQEETTFLQIPCLTFRSSTERPITVELGTNQLLADLDPANVAEKFEAILRGETKRGVIPPFWDGQAAGRIAAKILAF